jgi:hypothetical protein
MRGHESLPAAIPEKEFVIKVGCYLRLAQGLIPDVYLKVIAGLLPKDLNLNLRQLDDLSDEQLLARLAQLTEMAKPLLAKRDEAISTAGLTRQ